MSRQVTERRQILYKNSKFDFLDLSRFRRSKELNNSRKKNRMMNLDAKRNIPPAGPVSPAKLGERVVQGEDEKLKAIAKQKKCEKPAFKTGTVHRKVTGSPILIMTNAHARKNFLVPDQIEKVNKAAKLCFDDELKKQNTNLVQNGKQIRTALPQLPKNETKQNKTRDRNLAKSKFALAMKTNPQPVKNLNNIKKKVKIII